MIESLKPIQTHKTYAYVVPLTAFMVLNWVMQVIDESGLKWSHSSAPWWRAFTEHWMLPIQSIVCIAILIFFWKQYSFRPFHGWWLGLLGGVVGITLWLLPTILYDYLGMTESSVGVWKHFGLAPRLDGFDPGDMRGEFGEIGVWVSGFCRFIRAVVVVALVEEIFWRGFLMRYLIDPDGDYWKVPFGVAHWKSYLITTGAFILAHQPVDYLGALLFGTLMYGVAVRTKSLFACVLMHGVANLLMGIYALYFQKFGLW